MRFLDRSDAGRQLAVALSHLREEHPVVVGLPRGGVVVAAEVARHLDAPLDVILVRKLGFPSQPELAIGAIGEGGVQVLNHRLIQSLGVTDETTEQVAAQARRELDRRVAQYREVKSRTDLDGRTVIVVDDGIATGATAMAALQVARESGAARTILAVPVAPQHLPPELSLADELVALDRPASLSSVGQWYDDFRPTSDEQVLSLLAGSTADTSVRVGSRSLPGRLTVPTNPMGLVMFAHGSGSSRLSPRNRAVADALNRRGLATLLFDLLDPAEEAVRQNVFDVELLGHRLAGAIAWAGDHPALGQLPLGLFGASTGAAAAIWAASQPHSRVQAIVSRGGRPDLGLAQLPDVSAPTLLIVGQRDTEVIELNKRAAHLMRCDHELVLVDGAGHLFEEPGALERVAQLAGDWFTSRLTR